MQTGPSAPSEAPLRHHGSEALSSPVTTAVSPSVLHLRGSEPSVLSVWLGGWRVITAALTAPATVAVAAAAGATRTLIIPQEWENREEQRMMLGVATAAWDGIQPPLCLLRQRFQATDVTLVCVCVCVC